MFTGVDYLQWILIDIITLKTKLNKTSSVTSTYFIGLSREYGSANHLSLGRIKLVFDG